VYTPADPNVKRVRDDGVSEQVENNSTIRLAVYFMLQQLSDQA